MQTLKHSKLEVGEQGATQSKEHIKDVLNVNKRHGKCERYTMLLSALLDLGFYFLIWLHFDLTLTL